MILHLNDHIIQLPCMNRYLAVNYILVCDNAKIHRGGRIKALCDEAGVRLIYLPPYCPELNPIELCFAAMKSRLRHTQVLSYALDSAWEIRSSFTHVTTADLLHKLYDHCGYNLPDLDG